MYHAPGLNDEDSVTMKALAAFGNAPGTPVPQARVGYGFLLEKLLKKGFILSDAGYCTLTPSGSRELARLAAI